MYRIPRGDVSWLKTGDIFTLHTVSESELEHTAPSRDYGSSAPAKNPFDGTYWIFVQRAEIDEKYWVKVLDTDGKYIGCTTIADQDRSESHLFREGEETTKEVRGNSRSERVEWEGTPQSRSDRNQTGLKSRDIRGSKNDLLNGHL